MLLTLPAVAVGAATFEKALQKGGVNRIGRESEGAQEMGLALAQGEGGEALEFFLTHIMRKILLPSSCASENEKTPRKRKRP